MPNSLLDFYHSFNSIKVRLERFPLDRDAVGLKLFQFHKGTIRTIVQSFFACSIIGFNSIKVRLEPLSPFLRKFIVGFQFHKGTIRTTFLLYLFSVSSPFQFHKGTIRTNERVPGTRTPGSFNSIKVRLEHSGTSTTTAEQAFQFHKGTIRTFFFPRSHQWERVSIP